MPRSPAASSIAARPSGTAFQGRYIFADFVSSRVWSVALTLNGAGEATASDLREHTSAFGGVSQLSNISSFGVDADGELYLVSYGRGVILKDSRRAVSAVQLANHSITPNSKRQTPIEVHSIPESFPMDPRSPTPHPARPLREKPNA